MLQIGEIVDEETARRLGWDGPACPCCGRSKRDVPEGEREDPSGLFCRQCFSTGEHWRFKERWITAQRWTLSKLFAPRMPVGLIVRIWDNPDVRVHCEQSDCVYVKRGSG